MADLAKTNIRLAPYIEVQYAKIGGYIYRDSSGALKYKENNKESNFTNPTKLKIFGYVPSVKIESERDINTLHVLGHKIEAKPVEIYPGPASYKVTLEHIVLYDESVLGDIFNVTSNNSSHYGVISQKDPLYFQFDFYNPNKGDDIADLHVFAKGCWLDKYPLDIKMDRDLQIKQELAFTCLEIEYSGEAYQSK